MSSSDTVVVGGGVVGVCAAYYLADAGHKVTLLERDEVCPMGASSYGNAGLICPSDVVPLAFPGVLGKGLKWMLDDTSPFFVHLRADPHLWRWLWLFRRACTASRVRASMPVLRTLGTISAQLHADLAAGREQEYDYQQRGWIMAYETSEGAQAAVREVEEARSVGVAAEILDGEAIRERLPGVVAAGGVFNAENGVIDPKRFVRVLAKSAEERGASIESETDVLGFERNGRNVLGVVTTKGTFDCDSVVLAAGAWTPLLSKMLGVGLPIQGAKGYSIDVERPSWAPDVPVLLAEGHAGLSPLADRLRFAGTLELTGLDMAVNQRRVLGIRRAIARGFPKSADLKQLEVWRGIRPLTPDGLPIVGRLPGWDNVIVASGHCMNGISLGPGTGKVVAQMVAGQEPEMSLDPMRAERFAWRS